MYFTSTWQLAFGVRFTYEMCTSSCYARAIVARGEGGAADENVHRSECRRIIIFRDAIATGTYRGRGAAVFYEQLTIIRHYAVS